MRHCLPACALSAFMMTAIAAAPALAQPGGAPMPQLFASAGDVSGLIAKAKSQIKAGQPMLALPIVQLAPYRANLEYRVAVGPASIHEKEAELFLVLEGSGTVVTGGALKEEKRTNPENRSGSGIEGGNARRVGKGDFILVPENTGHWFSTIDGTLVLMSIHLPRAH